MMKWCHRNRIRLAFDEQGQTLAEVDLPASEQCRRALVKEKRTLRSSRVYHGQSGPAAWLLFYNQDSGRSRRSRSSKQTRTLPTRFPERYVETPDQTDASMHFAHTQLPSTNLKVKELLKMFYLTGNTVIDAR